MRAPSKYIKVKLFLGFGSLLVILLFTLVFIYQNVKVLTVIDEDIVLDTDSVSSLVHAKDLKAKELIEALSQLNSDLMLSSSNVEKLLSKREAIPPPVVQKQVEIKKDTILTKPKKKKFFRRLKEAFVPAKGDSVVKVSTSKVIAIDTLYHGESGVNASDSLALAELKKGIAADNRKRRSQYSKAKRLENMSMEISMQIDTILTDYNEARFFELFEKIRDNNERRQESVFWIGIIAVAGILLTTLFSVLLLGDINKRNKYRIALEKANARAADLLNAREKLMLTITHDIKAPIGTIMGYSELLHKTNLTDQQKSYLESIDHSSTHAFQLIYDLLDYHSLDLNRANINKTLFNAYDLLDEVRHSFIPQFAAKAIDFSSDVKQEELNVMIESDRVRMVQILNNLLSNALKFTSQGKVVLASSLKKDVLTLRVSDTGTGMSKEEKEKLFKEFTRLPNAQGQEGFGLGLSIVKKILDCLGGKIEVESKQGEGTSFIVKIPVEIKEDLPSELFVKSNNKVFPPNTRILLFDDDVIQLNLTTLMLENHGAKVTSSNHIDELFSLLKEERFDLLITDIQMPAIDGFKLLELLRASNIKSYQDIPVLAVSARTFVDEAEFIDHGFIGVLTKPFQISDVITKLRSINESIEWIPVASTEQEESLHTTLDLQGLREFVGQDDGALGDILLAFVEDAREQIIALNLAIDTYEPSKVGAIAHKLYPTVKLLSDDDLANLLASVQSQIAHEANFDITSVTAEITSKLDSLVEEIVKIVDQIKLK